MRIHFIAIGGSAMHNLALALHDAGHIVTGSDDEIYEPSRSRLEKAGLLPAQYGWYIDKIEPKIDAVILGMHARGDNPELIAAQKLGLPIYSYPEFIASQSADKTRIVVAGSHGKTTTTSIIMHALVQSGIEYDYLVGAQLEGFDRMVKLSEADIIILEGDEYLSSPIDRRPKMMHYEPDIAIITGIAWDHINVFPTFENYVDQFRIFVESMGESSLLYYYHHDESMQKILSEHRNILCEAIGYDQIELNEKGYLQIDNDQFKVNLIGNHNLQNILAAELVCRKLGVSRKDFYGSLETFTGAHKRLELLQEGQEQKGYVYLDFAHAPSKVKATVQAIKDWYPDTPLIAVFELHTYSSLNKDFIPQYQDALNAADQAVVYFSEHALKMKKMPALDSDFIRDSFAHPNLDVVSDVEVLRELILSYKSPDSNLLLMTSGTFGNIGLEQLLSPQT